MNEYLRQLNHGYNHSTDPASLPMWEEQGDFLTIPEGYKWRLERSQTVADLLHVGDIIGTSWSTGGLVINISRHVLCPCPYRKISTTKLCQKSWDEPELTPKYHRDVFCWSLIYVPEGCRQTKAGRFFESDYCYINELVAWEGRIKKLFADDEDEVFLVNKHYNIKPIQLSLL